MNERMSNKIVLMEKRLDAVLARYWFVRKARNYDVIEFETIHHEDILREIIQEAIDSGLWVIDKDTLIGNEGEKSKTVIRLKKIPAAID